MSNPAVSPFNSDDDYRRLRRRLIGSFARRGCNCADDLADETLVRVLSTHAERPSDCALDRWAFAIARYVLFEWLRHTDRNVQFDPLVENRAVEGRFVVRYLPEFEIDLLPLDTSDRAFLRGYFIEQQGARALAQESGLSEAGVRSRARRILISLRAHFLGTASHRRAHPLRFRTARGAVI